MKSEILRVGETAILAFEFASAIDRAQVEHMAEAVQGAIREGNDLRLLLDLSATDRIEPGAFASGRSWLASLESIGPVSRYAVSGAPAIAATVVEVFGKVLPLESRAFETGEDDKARAWVARPPG